VIVAEKTIAQKLLIKPGHKVFLVNAPKGYKSTMGVLPDKATIVSKPVAPIDIIQVFVANRKELEAQLPKLKPLLAPNGILWVTYLKGTSKTKTALNRDTIYPYALTLGLQTVAMISIDDGWSAMRMKRA
jgi:hypothetical protein